MSIKCIAFFFFKKYSGLTTPNPYISFVLKVMNAKYQVKIMKQLELVSS